MYDVWSEHHKHTLAFDISQSQIPSTVRIQRTVESFNYGKFVQDMRFLNEMVNEYTVQYTLMLIDVLCIQSQWDVYLAHTQFFLSVEVSTIRWESPRRTKWMNRYGQLNVRLSIQWKLLRFNFAARLIMRKHFVGRFSSYHFSMALNLFLAHIHGT